MTAVKEKEGIIYGAVSYVLWGIVPIYWKQLEHISAIEILIHRVLWSCMFMMLLLAVTRKLPALREYIKEIAFDFKKLLALFAASALVSANWGIFIWAVNNGRILDTSLGYYMNPLISVLLGVIVLKERLSKAQVVSFGLAAVGVLILTLYFGEFPWISFGLALSFAFYGLVKVMIGAEAAIGLTLETLMMLPVAIGYLFFSFAKGDMIIPASTDLLLLIGGGIATAMPLLLFAIGANNIPFTLLGFLQYIAPTLSMLVGVLLYGEVFTKVHALSYAFIWSALLLFSFSQFKMRISRQAADSKKAIVSSE